MANEKPGSTATPSMPAGSAASDTAAGRMGRAKEFVGEKYAAASETVKEKYSTVRSKVEEIDFNDLTEQVRGYVRSNPGKALLISIGVGFVIGMLLKRGDKDDE